MDRSELLGIGLYTPADAGCLIAVPAQRLRRWLRGHTTARGRYEALWKPQVDLEDGHVYLGFRDLMEARVADAFIRRGLSAQKVRRAIVVAGEIMGVDRPLSTSRFRTDGRSVFLQMRDEDGADRIVDVLRRQYAFRDVIEPSLKTVDFDSSGAPTQWWPAGRRAGIVVDPDRSFEQPIDHDTSIPTAALATAVAAEGSIDAASRAWGVPATAFRRALAFERKEELPQAA